MNIALWIVAIVLAVGFAAAGAIKLSQSKDKLAASGMGWTESYSESAVKAIGAVEVLGAVGLILPAVVGLAPILVPLAATGLALVMAGAIVTHARRGETQPIVINVVLLALAAFVAWGRFGPYAF
ncbi:DoxX family protein (plasmid) [Rhodococcus opacus]|uniref:DoxX family protein n=1 Tax=Rhodococcus opacus TaxID=37919 RepID=UPI0034D32063